MAARRLTVLGGGQQGRVIAADLARALPAVAVTVADLRAPTLARLPNLSAIELDLSDATVLARLASECDLVVGALPSRLGFAAMQAVIDAGRPMVDVSFSAENPLSLDAAARRAGVALVPDCGLAPGLSHLLVGQAVAAHGTPRDVTIRVGGVAQDRDAPYGYVVTWSVEDLLEEYVRPARIVRGGREVSVPAFDDLQRVDIPGVGEMEDFFSDGLRTLLETLPGVTTMGERTLRWPGHAAAIQPLVADGRFVGEIRSRCAVQPARDLVVLDVVVSWAGLERRATLIDRFDAASGLTAMARTTALTTAAVARLAATHGIGAPGVTPLERLAHDPAASAFVLGALAEHGIRPTLRESAAA